MESRTLRYILDKFWDERFWLPSNMTWADVAPGPDKAVRYTNPKDLIYDAIPLALGFLCLRYFVLEKYVYSPFGKYLGIQNSKLRKAPSNPKLEKAYKANPKLKEFDGLAKQLDMSERQVQWWWRLRRSQDKPSILVKFCENAWAFTYHMSVFIYGLTIMWDKEWLWDVDYCFIGHPHQDLTKDVWWYYMLTAAFFWSSTITQFWDVRRKDFWQTFVHHIATIVLITFSWFSNFYRIGTLVILSHDCSEIFLEISKAALYAKYQRLCDVFFIAFTLVWIVTRLIYYPFYVIRSSIFRAPVLMPMMPVIYILIAMLCVLAILNFLWTYMILQVLYSSIGAGKLEKDIRSSSEISEISDSFPNENETTARDNCMPATSFN